MSIAGIVTLSIFGYILLAILVTWIQGYFSWRWCCKKARNVTEPTVDSLGPAVVFSGLQGAGKSTCAAGAATVQSKIYLERAAKRQEEIRLIFHDVDFSELDSAISFCFDNRHYNTDHILLSIFAACPQYKEIFGSGAVDYGLNYFYKLDLLRDYIDASVAILKANPVYFIDSQFYNHYTHRYALPLTHGSTAIRDRYLSHDWNIYRYSVIFEDEVLLGSGNNQNREKEAAEDPGVDAFLELIRHIGKGNIKYFMVAQDFERLNKARRELVNSIVDMTGFKVIQTHPLENWIFTMAAGILNYLARFIRDSLPKSFYARRHQVVNPLRSALGRLQFKLQHLAGYNYIRYDAKIYHSSKDWQKPPSECRVPVTLCRFWFPAVWCWGSLNTYEYSSVYDVLSFESRNCPAALDIDPVPSRASREKYAKKVLTKRSASSSAAPQPSASAEVPLVT